MKVFYHIDNDGKCAGFWVKKFAFRDEYETEFIPINYNIPFPFDKINKNEKVYIVDFSIKPDEMDKLLEITPNVTWIDHHKTAVAAYKDYDKEIHGIRYDGIAGCMLTYCYLMFMTEGGERHLSSFNLDMVVSAPMFTKYIADYDVWHFEYGDDTRKFEKGFVLYPHEPTDKIWEDLYEEHFLDKERRNVHFLPLVNKIIKQGETIIDYRKAMMTTYCEHKGFAAKLDDYKVFAVNMAMMNSDDFIVDNPNEYDMFVGFSFDGDMWNYALRATKDTVDCSEVAKKYGGGGHRGAAGCNTKDFLLMKIE